MGKPLKDRKDTMPQTAGQPSASKMEELAELVAQLREEEALSLIRGCVDAHVPPAHILSACQKGMRMVGALHEKGQYFIAGLIMAGEIMRQAVDLLRPVIIHQKPEESLGRVLVGTIQGDIHDIGKNLFRDLLECHGFTVLDLGVDVPPADFVRAAAEFDPHFIAVSVLITDSFPYLRRLVELFHDATPENTKRPLILIGGGQVDDRIYHMCGSDYWAPDAFAGVRLCMQLVAGPKPT
jgi:methanogenic corrinoid protein MtbC1